MILSVEAENLLSFKELHLEFQSGITLIEGYNYDNKTNIGAGKSAILDIICFTLFGEIPRDVKTDEILRLGTKSGLGKVELTNGYGIVRSRKPNDIFLYKLETPLDKIKGKDAKETQQIIEDLLGMSFKTFCQAIYFAQNYQNKFVTASEEDKAKILSEIDDLSQFDKARKETMNRIKTLETEYNLVLRDHQNYQKSMESLSNHKGNLIDLKGKFEIQRKEKWNDAVSILFDLDSKYDLKKKEHEELLQIVDLLNQQLQDKRTNQDKILETQNLIRSEIVTIETEAKNVDRMTKIQSDYEKSWNKLSKEIDSIQDKKNQLLSPKSGDLCPTCGSDLSKADSETINKHLEELDTKSMHLKSDRAEILSKSTKLELELKRINVPTEKLNELKNDLKALEDTKRSIELEKNSIQSKINLIDKLESELNMLKYKADQARQVLKSIELENTSDIDAQLDKISNELNDEEMRFIKNSDLKENLADKLSRLNTLKDGFKDIKSFAFRNTLLELNYKANDYLSRLFNQTVEIRFFNESEEGELSKIHCEVTIDGNKRSLGLYSGGQSRLIQLSVDLALSDLISSRNRNSIYFRIFDEYFQNLDEASMEACLQLFQELKGTTLLIEHNSLFKAIISNTINIELRNGISEVIENGSSNLAMQNM